MMTTVALPGTVQSIQHALETRRGTYVVSYGLKSPDAHKVIEVDATGRPLREYGSVGGVDRLDRPFHLCSDRNSRILVADHFNRRVLLLDSRLKLQTIPLRTTKSSAIRMRVTRGDWITTPIPDSFWQR